MGSGGTAIHCRKVISETEAKDTLQGMAVGIRTPQARGIINSLEGQAPRKELQD